MTCILKRPDYLELTEAAALASQETTQRVIALSTRLTGSMNQSQRALFDEIEELTSLETVQALSGLSRRFCQCSECREKIAA